MTYLDDYDLLYTTDNDLHKKVTRGLDKTARDIINEDVPASGLDVYGRRVGWAQWIRSNPENAVREAHRSMMYMLDNATVAASGNTAPDSDVQFATNSIVNDLASGGYR